MYINSLKNCLASKFDHSHPTFAPYCMASHVYILICPIIRIPLLPHIVGHIMYTYGVATVSRID